MLTLLFLSLYFAAGYFFSRYFALVVENRTDFTHAELPTLVFIFWPLFIVYELAYRARLNERVDAFIARVFKVPHE